MKHGENSRKTLCPCFHHIMKRYPASAEQVDIRYRSHLGNGDIMQQLADARGRDHAMQYYNHRNTS